MMAILHGYEHGKAEYTGVMKNGAIIFMPMVNVDGVTFISDKYFEEGKFEFIRKNRQIYSHQARCRWED